MSNFAPLPPHPGQQVQSELGRNVNDQDRSPMLEGFENGIPQKPAQRGIPQQIFPTTQQPVVYPPPYNQKPLLQQVSQHQPYYAPQVNYYNPYVAVPSGWLPPQIFHTGVNTAKTVAVITGSLAALTLIIILALTALNFGAKGAIMSMFLACFPLALVFGCLVWVGKWNSKPWGLRIAAFVWGGAGAVLLVLLTTTLVNKILGAPTTELISSSIQAPFIEEFSKGIAILVIALFLRKNINGPIDGIIYIASIAAGFAFTENILYLSSSYAQHGMQGITQTFFLRAVMSPFAHVVFSLPMGLMVGLARSRGLSRVKLILLWFAIYPLSVTLHGLWNASSTVLTSSESWFLFYGLLEFPLFAIAVVVVILLRVQEAKLTFRRLTEYGHAGWFTAMEVDTFATWAGRKNAMLWAKGKSPHAGEIMREITEGVVDLSYNREHIIRSNGNNELFQIEQKLLDKIIKNKNYLLTL